jgi:hypothetical protein
MSLYTVNTRSLLPDPVYGVHRIYEAGETINFDGVPGANLTPIDSGAAAAAAQATADAAAAQAAVDAAAAQLAAAQAAVDAAQS